MDGFVRDSGPFGFGPLEHHEALGRRTGRDRRGGDRRSGLERRRWIRREQLRQVAIERRSGNDRRHHERRSGRERRSFESLKESAWRALLGE